MPTRSSARSPYRSPRLLGEGPAGRRSRTSKVTAVLYPPPRTSRGARRGGTRVGAPSARQNRQRLPLFPRPKEPNAESSNWWTR
ncbi:hypothetical protein CapIbe_020829 [Capra ibex]